MSDVVATLLLAYLSYNPRMTRSQLIAKLQTTGSFVDHNLGLRRLEPSIKKQVTRNLIPLLNAFALAKLPKEQQKQYVDFALVEQPKCFVPRIKHLIKRSMDNV